MEKPHALAYARVALADRRVINSRQEASERNGGEGVMGDLGHHRRVTLLPVPRVTLYEKARARRTWKLREELEGRSGVTKESFL